MTGLPTYDDVVAAHERIAKQVHKTPVLSSAGINELFGIDVVFKCENFQKVGAFKFRGATNAVLSLSYSEALHGVATHSSGNHAAALALAARRRGIPCYVVMPENAPLPKIEAVRSYGADITFCEPTLAAREQTLAEILTETGAAFIHPYDNPAVISGQGTAAREFLQETGHLDALFVPVGGGGLLSGSALAAKAMQPAIRVFGCEPLNADDACRSYYSGVLQAPLKPNTMADGLLTALSERTFAIIRQQVDGIFTVTEQDIMHAMRLIWQRMKIIIEPSSAVPVAALFNHSREFEGLKTGIILSGGNVDLLNLPFGQETDLFLQGSGQTR